MAGLTLTPFGKTVEYGGGVGSGRVFPWYSIEDKFIAAPGAGIIGTPFGVALNSAHSVFVAVLTELGILMFLVLCASVVLVWANAWHDVRRRSAWAVTSMVLAATTAAWVFDTYLLKNFAVSTWWWLIAGCVLASHGCDGERVGSWTTATRMVRWLRCAATGMRSLRNAPSGRRNACSRNSG